MKLPKRPKIASLSRADISKMELKLPSGKMIVLGRGLPPYTTADFYELEFLANQRFVMLTDVDNTNYLRYLETVEIKPTVNTPLSDDEIKSFQWKDGIEDVVLAELKKRGYVCEKVGENGQAENRYKAKSIKAYEDKVVFSEAVHRGFLTYKTKDELLEKLSDDELGEELRKRKAESSWVAYKKK